MKKEDGDKGRDLEEPGRRDTKQIARTRLALKNAEEETGRESKKHQAETLHILRGRYFPCRTQKIKISIFTAIYTEKIIGR